RPRREGAVLRLARQSRRSQPALLPAVQHERRAVLQLQEGQARESRGGLLRTRQQLHAEGAAGLARARAQGVGLAVEDRVFPSPAVFVRRATWIGNGSALAAPAAVPAIRRSEEH